MLTTFEDAYSDCLAKAEEMFGKQITGVTITGIIYHDKHRPLLAHTGKNTFTIVLPDYYKTHFNDGVFELAHEVVHCLSPTDNLPPTVLEEGLASFFSVEYMRDHGYTYSYTDPKYLQAYNLTKELLFYNADIIKKIRGSSQSIISKILKDDLLNVNNSIPEELAIKLTQQFIY
ncbi:MAG: hypothetical protein ABUL44_03185 [Flavobacterium sp.]